MQAIIILALFAILAAVFYSGDSIAKRIDEDTEETFYN